MIKFLGILLVIGLAVAAPVTNSTEDSEKIIVNGELFVEQFAKYESQHTIVSLLVPLNAVNFDDDDDDESSSDDTNTDITVYFVEADIGDNGVKDYKGLYSLRNGVVNKILETGTDAAAANDDTREVYFSAKDGIYVFNVNKTEKYGSITDSFIGILKVNGSDTLYVLTENHEVYKVTDSGNKKEKLDAVKNAQQFVLDNENNLFFYGPDKVPYVVTDTGVQRIEGLPANPSYVQLIRPPFIVDEGAIFASDNAVYVINTNGTSELTDFVLEVKPTAYAPEATLIQYYAYNKKIYEYNVLEIILSDLLTDLKSFLSDKTEVIQSIATRSRSELKA